MKQSYLFVAGWVLFSAVPGLMTANDRAASWVASTYSRDTKGLEKEYQPFLKALSQGQAPPFDKEFAALTLPDPAAWFGEYFEVDQVHALVDDYNAEIATEQKGEFTVLTKLWPSGTRFKVHCKTHPSSAPEFPPRADAYQPTKPVQIEQFQVEFEADRLSMRGGYTLSILVNTVWVDGAYRYLGKGFYPFWSMPDRLHQKGQMEEPDKPQI